jgi:hypothetical protein
MPPKKPSKIKSQIKQWAIEMVSLADMKPAPYNPRTISPKHLAGLTMSLKRFGYVEPIIWNRLTGYIVGGHQRFKVLSKEGVKEAQVVVVEMSVEDELAANLTMNNPEVEGQWDDPALELLSRVEAVDPDFFAGAGFDELRKAVEDMAPTSGEDSYSDKNQEVDVDDLVSDCDTECPCCKFKWKVDDRDVHTLSPEELEEIERG